MGRGDGSHPSRGRRRPSCPRRRRDRNRVHRGRAHPRRRPEWAVRLVGEAVRPRNRHIHPPEPTRAARLPDARRPVRERRLAKLSAVRRRARMSRLLGEPRPV